MTPASETTAGAGPRVDADQNRIALGLTGSFLLALMTWFGAYIAIPLPPDGVPMTLQSLFVLLAALGLGPRYGALAMLIYICVGALGGAVFAEGRLGFDVLLGSTGGYIIGFLACQPIVGFIVRRSDGMVRGWGAMVLAVIAANTIIFGFGVPWLAAVRGLEFGRAIQGGLVPFIPGMLIKGALAVVIAQKVTPWAARRFW